MKKTYILTDKALQKLKHFDPTYYGVLAQYVWWYYNISKQRYITFEIEDLKTNKNGLKIVHKSKICIDSEDMVCNYTNDDQPVTPFDVASKQLSFIALLKYSEFTYLVIMICGFIIGYITGYMTLK